MPVMAPKVGAGGAMNREAPTDRARRVNSAIKVAKASYDGSVISSGSWVPVHSKVQLVRTNKKFYPHLKDAGNAVTSKPNQTGAPLPRRCLQA